MTVRFLHTADWQIGKVFRFVDRETMGVLQDARLNAIDRLGQVAVARDVHYILVAGDVYDVENLSDRSLNQPIERMRKYVDVNWYLLPGNHDPYRPNGLWHRLQKSNLPNNVHICQTTEPILIESNSVAILPAPLQFKSTLTDPTEHMDSVDLPADCIRVGLAHGSVTIFGSGNGDAKNYIDPSRPDKANLSYLALGDWHGQKKINDRCWYSGTPETDSFDVEGGGKALVVTVHTNPSATVVETVETGEFRWETCNERIYVRKQIEALQHKLAAFDQHLERVLVRLNVEGSLSLEDRNYFEEIIVQRFNASFRVFSVNVQHLHLQLTNDDLNQIDTGGFVRKAAENLQTLAEHSDELTRKLAGEALQRLYIELKKLEAEGR